MAFPLLLSKRKQGGGVPVFAFDSSLATFTPGMAKRAGSLFAGAPIVQGDPNNESGLVDDVLSFPGRDGQIKDFFYSNNDAYQGTYFMFLTPEYGSADLDGAGDHYVYAFSAGTNLYYRYDSNDFVFTVAGKSFVLSHTLVAGTTIAIALRWDTKNTLDGTNYACISINDSHTFGMTTQPGTQLIQSSAYIGGTGNQNAASMIIEGFHAYRLPLSDGTYGVDIGKGDVLAQHYNSGSFKDPAEILGSWDCVLGVPTDASPGVLSTGTGEAWSHPHSSNLVTGGFCETDYGTSAWNNEGTPSIGPSNITGTARIFNWGYEWTSDAANEGIYQDVSVNVGDDWVVRAIAHADGTTSKPKCILYDQDNGAEIGSLVGTTGSSRTNPDVLLFTGEAPAGCTTLRVKIVNENDSGKMFLHQVELLTNLITNPSLQGGAGDPYIPTGWSNSGLDAGDTAQETTTVHSGSDSLLYNVGATGNEYIFQALSTSAGGYYCWGTWSYGNGSDSILIVDNNVDRQVKQASNTAVNDSAPTTAAWSLTHFVTRSVSTAPRLFYGGDSGASLYLDDVFYIALDPVSLTVTPASEVNSTENGGIRVDGWDSLTQPVPEATISNDYIKITFPYTPRHDPADVSVFNAFIRVFELYRDASNYIRFYWAGANQLRCEIVAGGSANLGSTGSGVTGIDAGVLYQAEFEYTKNGNVQFSVNEVLKYNKATTGSNDFAGLDGFTMYWGTSNTGSRQVDAVFGATS